MRAVIAALLLVAGVLAWQLTSEVKSNWQLRGQLADKSRLESLQLKEKCAQQAEKLFNALAREDPPRELLDTDDYQSHYNAKLAKCFI